MKLQSFDAGNGVTRAEKEPNRGQGSSVRAVVLVEAAVHLVETRVRLRPLPQEWVKPTSSTENALATTNCDSIIAPSPRGGGSNGLLATPR